LLRKITIKVAINFDFSVIGIVSVAKGYQLCSVINKHLSINLVRQSAADFDNNSEMAITSFRHNDEVTRISYSLVANKSGKGYLIPERSQVDFFLLIKGNHIKVKDIVLEKLKTMNNIQTAFEIAVDQLQSKENLILE